MRHSILRNSRIVTRHSTDERGVIFICLGTSIFISMALEGVTSFLPPKLKPTKYQ